MAPRSVPAALATLALLAAPAGAGAQGAGDQQYEDPFAGEGDPAAQPVDEPGQLSEELPSLGEAPPTGTPEPAPAPVEGAENEPVAASAPELPATGAEALVLGMLGTGLLMAGSGLRLRLRADDRRLA